MNDTELLEQVRDAFDRPRMEVPLEAIVARGRAHKRWRRSLAAGAAATVALVGSVVGVERSHSASVAPDPATAQLAAFTVSAAPGGDTALTLRKGAQYRLDPDALGQALAGHGIPALVTVGKTCDTDPEPNGLDRVVSTHRDVDGGVYLTIDPAAMPNGSKLSIGYYSTGTAFGLIEAAAPLHCAVHPPGSAPTGHHPVPVGSN
jgi:hypothetical protein